MVAKRKTVSTIVDIARASRAFAKDSAANTEEELDTQIVPVEELKKPVGAAAKKRASAENQKPEVEDEDDDMEDEDEQELTEEEALAQREAQITTARTKELKGMYMDTLKKVAMELSVCTGTKDQMIKSVLKAEAKKREEIRAHEAKIRAVVVKKKDELESTTLIELGKMCEAIGAKSGKKPSRAAKAELVAKLLVHWQENDGVDKALAQIALDERRSDLIDMDSTSLQKLCEKAGLDPYVKEVMVDRISKRENDMGRYSREVPRKETAETAQDVDVVDALLKNENTRKKEKALKTQQEEAEASKRKELKAMSIDELKKALTSKGLDATGKKEEMVEALFTLGMQEQAVASRRTELKKMSIQDLKELLTAQCLEVGGKEKMIETMLTHEAKRRAELQAFESKMDEAMSKRKEELQNMTNPELKQLCVQSGLAVGGGKEEKVERLLEEARNDGAIDKVVSVMIRHDRKQELLGWSKEQLLSLCIKLDVDPLVKEVLVERILDYEGDVPEPVTKKARK